LASQRSYAIVRNGCCNNWRNDPQRLEAIVYSTKNCVDCDMVKQMADRQLDVAFEVRDVMTSRKPTSDAVEQLRFSSACRSRWSADKAVKGFQPDELEEAAEPFIVTTRMKQPWLCQSRKRGKAMVFLKSYQQGAFGRNPRERRKCAALPLHGILCQRYGPLSCTPGFDPKEEAYISARSMRHAGFSPCNLRPAGDGREIVGIDPADNRVRQLQYRLSGLPAGAVSTLLWQRADPRSG
jgi:hypothetical protein